MSFVDKLTTRKHQTRSGSSTRLAYAYTGGTSTRRAALKHASTPGLAQSRHPANTPGKQAQRKSTDDQTKNKAWRNKPKPIHDHWSHAV